MPSLAGPSPAFRRTMRPLSQNVVDNQLPALQPHSHLFPAVLLLATVTCAAGCAGGLSAVVQPPPPPIPSPSSVSVTVAPATASLLLGNAQSFTATVTGATDTHVIWTVNGVSAGSPATGTITAAGVYTAPQNLPAVSTVTISAQSTADPTKQASAIITLVSDISIALTPSIIAVELGAMQPLRAALASNGQSNPAIRWSISGPSCPAACGTLDTMGITPRPKSFPPPQR